MKNLACDLSQNDQDMLLKFSTFQSDFLSFIASAFPELSSEQHSQILKMCKKFCVELNTLETLLAELLGKKPPNQILNVLKGYKNEVA